MRYYLTCAIDYVNSKPHLGTAYEKITADVIARYQRALGKDVLFLMGNDEHSVKVAQAAKERGLSPLAWCDQMEAAFKAAWTALDVAPTDFIRTSEERHKVAVRAMIERIEKKGDLFQKDYEGWYCVGCEAFKRPEDLQEGKCPEHTNRTPQWLKERNWFFNLQRYRDPLQEWFASHPQFLRPESRRNELGNVLEGGLQDISVSRSSVDWGITFPNDPTQVVYVWFDALINYVSATGWPHDEAKFARYWPADVHLVGKDITRFHAVIWPAMLMAAGLEPPKAVFGHGFVNMAGGRMSKDAGRVTDPLELARIYGADAIRYYLCAEAPFGQDLEWSEERLHARINGDLANALGNLASRTLGMIERYRQGSVGPRPAASALLAEVAAALPQYRAAMDDLDLRGGLRTAMDLVAKANLHIDRTQPFVLAKDPSRAGDLQIVLAEVANLLVVVSRMLFPFMPKKSAALHQMLTGHDLSESNAIATAHDAGIAADRIVAKGAGLFPRLDPKAPA